MKFTLRKGVSLITISALCSISAPVFADVLYDCNLVVNDAYSAINNLKLNTLSPLTKQDLESSMSNLRSYCCQQGIISNGCESSQQNTSGPESVYAFDQLVSQGFFKLDNKIDASKDTKAREWAENLSKWNDSGKGKIPLSIQNTFTEAWQPTKRLSANLKENTCQISNYDTLPLSARYTAVCKQAACIVRKFFIAAGDLDTRYDEQACEEAAKMRIDDEMTYIQTLMVRKTNTLMKETWQTYTQSYLLETRRATLGDKITNVNASLSSVNGKVQEGTRTCSVK